MVEKMLIMLGRFEEILIDPNHIVAVEAVAKLDRAGRPMLPPEYEEPSFQGSVIRLSTGNEIMVPDSVEEVFDKMQRVYEAGRES